MLIELGDVVGLAVGVERLVAPVERARRSRETRLSSIANSGIVDAALVHLVDVLHVDRTARRTISSAANPSLGEVARPLVLELPEERCRGACGVELRKRDGVGGEVGVLDVGDRLAERAQPGRDLRDHDLRDLPSSAASRPACAEVAPPPATSQKSRGSWPRSTDTERIPPIMFALMTS